MSDLRKAQEFYAEMQPVHDRIVDSLRRQGWSREDAVMEADEKMARWMKVKEGDAESAKEQNGAKP